MARSRTPDCKNVSQDGRVCDLYVGHYGPHKEKHLHSAWEDGE